MISRFSCSELDESSEKMPGADHDSCRKCSLFGRTRSSRKKRKTADYHPYFKNDLQHKSTELFFELAKSTKMKEVPSQGICQ